MTPKRRPDPKAPPPDLAAIRAGLAKELREYARARLVAMAEEEGRRHDLAKAALAAGFDDIPDFWARLDALGELAAHAEFPRLVELVERTRNITRKETAIPARIDATLLGPPAEKALALALEATRDGVRELLDRRSYVEAGRRYQDALAKPVARFFDEVFVMDEDARVRANRLALLRDVHGLLAERFVDLAEVARK